MLTNGERKQLKGVSNLGQCILQFSLLRLLFLTRIELDCLQRLQDNMATVSSKSWSKCLVASRAYCKRSRRTIVVHSLHCGEVPVLAEIHNLQKRKGKEALGPK